MHAELLTLLQQIAPHDAIEAEHLAITQTWLASGTPLHRHQRADDPPQHLVAYFILYDRAQQKILLVDHKKAGLWLPSGGHVEPDEHPHTTVEREVVEELGITASFITDAPLFITVTPTTGNVAPHTDISLWYLLHGDATRMPWFDPAEFHRIAWFALDALPLMRCDPHLARFSTKLRAWSIDNSP